MHTVIMHVQQFKARTLYPGSSPKSLCRLRDVNHDDQQLKSASLYYIRHRGFNFIDLCVFLSADLLSAPAQSFPRAQACPTTGHA